MPEPYGKRNISNAKIEQCSPHTVAAFIDWPCTNSGWKVRDRSAGDWVPGLLRNAIESARVHLSGSGFSRVIKRSGSFGSKWKSSREGVVTVLGALKAAILCRTSSSPGFCTDSPPTALGGMGFATSALAAIRLVELLFLRIGLAGNHIGCLSKPEADIFPRVSPLCPERASAAAQPVYQFAVRLQA
jgi:hypothetical protein